VSTPELDQPLDELVAAGILYPYQWVDAGYFDFRHQLLRDALYRSVPTAELRRLHARAAEFGDGLMGASEVHKSVHYERAGLRAQAFRTALAGAQAAAAVTSRFESFELYRRALANIPDDLPAAEAADVWFAYAMAGFAVDDVPASEEAATNARRLYLEAGKAVEAAVTLIDLASLCRRDMRPRTERKRLLDAADQELAALPESETRNDAYAFLRKMQAVLELDVANLAEARRRIAEARWYAARAGLDDAAAEAARLELGHMSAWADVLGGDATGGLPRMLDFARQARDQRLEGAGVTNYRMTGDIAARVMEYPTSSIGVTEGIRFADAVEQSYCRHVMSALTAVVAWADGRWDEAVPIAELELVQRGSRRGSIGSRAALGFIAFGRGDVERARTLLDASLAITRPSGEVDQVLPALWGQAETSLVDADPSRALDHCWEAVELAEPTGERALLVPFVVTGVRAALQQRRPELAQKWLDRITPMLATWPDLARPALEHADGLIRTAAGSTVTARTALESAVRGWDGRGRIWESTWARLDLAAALARGNRHAEAMPILAEVLATARRLGSLPLLRRAEELDRSTRSRAGEQEPWHPLSTREFEVARAIADGMTNTEIAEQLFVSPKTVSAHVEHILAKLGVSRRTEVAAWVATVAAAPAGGHR
jgi:DNA-binding CsgD family transcriptional regulator